MDSHDALNLILLCALNIFCMICYLINQDKFSFVVMCAVLSLSSFLMLLWTINIQNDYK